MGDGNPPADGAPLGEDRHIDGDKRPPDGRRVREIAKQSLVDDKAENIVVIDLAGKTDIADQMIIASGRSQRHIAAITEHLAENLKKSGVPSVNVEGRRQADWILLDAGDVIVHIFRPEVRAFYNLEKMWSVPLPEQAVV
jgi:ribosome-associated protein